MSNSFNGKISEKEFINEIKGCKTIDLKDFKKEVISEKVDKQTGVYTTILKIDGYFNITMKKAIRPTKDKDSILELILQELKEIKTDVAEIKIRVTNLEKDITDIKKCPTIQKELAELN